MFYLEIDRPASSLFGREPDQQCKAVGIGRDCVSAGVAMPWQVINEIIGEMWSERGH
jgi:hypothetical protein